MKYQYQEKARADIAEKSIRDIEAVNKYIDGLHGTIISIQRIRAGQARPYADSVDEALIFCHQPNVMTTNAPLLRVITRKDAEAIARIFVGSWSDNPQFLETRLESLTPEPNPCGLEECKGRTGDEVRSSCWRVVLRSPYND